MHSRAAPKRSSNGIPQTAFIAASGPSSLLSICMISM